MDIEQRGDRATLTAWNDRTGADWWDCKGRGEIRDHTFHFRWAGDTEEWRGWAHLELIDGELRGTFEIEPLGTGIQYCLGVRSEE
ncbi:hypothetical protein ACFL59_11990 [Planctomycetota bacterium]